MSIFSDENLRNYFIIRREDLAISQPLSFNNLRCIYTGALKSKICQKLDCVIEMDLFECANLFFF